MGHSFDVAIEEYDIRCRSGGSIVPVHHCVRGWLSGALIRPW